MPRTGDFLIRRKGSANWYLQLIVPPDFRADAANQGIDLPAKHVQSMHTDDRVVARSRSATLVEDFKGHISAYRWNAAQKQMPFEKWRELTSPKHEFTYKMQPGRHENEDGTVTIATEKSIFKLDRDGLPMSGTEAPNFPVGEREAAMIPDAFGGKPFHFVRERKWPADYDRTKANLRRVADEPKQDIDNEIIDNWAKMKNIDFRFVGDAKATLKLFHDVAQGRNFYKADYDDGVALADALFARGNKSATVRKKIAFLRAAYNEAQLNPKRFPGIQNKTNPFSRVIRKVDDDALTKVMLDDADVALIKSRIGELGQNERMLLMWCLATGCRRGEPFDIRGERVIDGYRTISFGSKTPASYRTIPLPPVLLELHPEPIAGPIFTDSEIMTGKRINAWFRKIGITDPGKTLHSARHRASTKLRRFKDSVRWECLGHENRADPSEEYGVYPQDELDEALRMLW